MLATPSGKIAGSVSGGCVEGATATEIASVIASGKPKLIEFGVSDESAWEVGLACGGKISVFVEPDVRPEIVDAIQKHEAFGLATITDGSGPLGASVLVYEDGTTVGPLSPTGTANDDAKRQTARLTNAVDAFRKTVLEALPREQSLTKQMQLLGGESSVFYELYPRPPKLVIFGGVHVAAHLVTLAKTLGFRTVVADGREAFVSRARFPDVDELVHAWPEEAFAKIGLDTSTYVCVLSHDPKFDDPALEIALRSSARYVGAIGSRRNQAERRERLKRAGVTAAQVARLKGPIGLDLGGRQPAETALAILAEIVSVRNGSAGQPLATSAT